MQRSDLKEIRIEDDLYLRPITVEDTDDVLRWRNREYVKKYFIYREDISREEHLNWIEKKVKAGTVIQYIIIYKDKPIGSAYVQGVDYEAKKAEYGIFIGEMAGLEKGVGTKCAIAFNDYIMDEFGIEYIFSRILTDNVRSIRHCLSAGFVEEKVVPEAVEIEGEKRDIVVVSRTRK